MKKLLSALVALLISSVVLSPVQAIAGCRDYPESVSEPCISINLAEEQARQAEYQARMAQEVIDAQKRAEQAAHDQWGADGSRACSVFPASVTPDCVAENLAYEKQRQAANEAKAAQEQIDAKKREEENNYKNWMADGGRACALYPASVTPECVTENLAYEQKRQIAYAAKVAKDLIDAQALAAYQQKRQLEAADGRVCVLYPEAATPGCLAETKAYNEQLVTKFGKDVAKTMIASAKAALEQAREDYIQGGRRECTTYPASLKPECITENAAYADETAAQVAALEAFKAEHEKLKTVALRDEAGDLLVDALVPAKVDLLVAKVKLLDKKNRVVDTADIKYDSTDDPYFVFDNADKAGSYKLVYSVGKKKTAGAAVKVPQA